MTVRQKFLVLLVVIPALTVLWAQFWPGAWWLFVIWLPLAVIGLWDMFQTKQTLRRLYPVLGHFRYLLESFRTEIQQYFIETDLSGKPVNREHRALVYQRAKGQRDTRPFGTILDVNDEGYEWINHSVSPAKIKYYHPRVTIGGKDCKQPYQASLLNISAMSYGSLGHNAIEALNLGAKRGGFAHNTGE
ncbi:MAG: FMN-binding glutamate synthase family protein, partial [Proteobacteria bacterium]